MSSQLLEGIKRRNVPIERWEVPMKKRTFMQKRGVMKGILKTGCGGPLEQKMLIDPNSSLNTMKYQLFYGIRLAKSF